MPWFGELPKQGILSCEHKRILCVALAQGETSPTSDVCVKLRVFGKRVTLCRGRGRDADAGGDNV